MKIDLSGKIALITGATGQLGRVMVRTMAECGADIVVCYYRNEAMAHRLVGEVAALGRRAVIQQVDITDEASVYTLRDQINASLGEPDIIVDCAVSEYSWTSILEQPLADYEDQYRTCVLHSVLMAKAFVPAMMRKGWGRVIGMNTECAVQCFPTQSAYAAAKRGMDGIQRVLAREVGPYGITVNQVAPGIIISDKDREAGIEDLKEYDAKVPLRRRGFDQEVANVVTFLASDLARFVTGAFIPISGGNVMTSI